MSNKEDKTNPSSFYDPSSIRRGHSAIIKGERSYIIRKLRVILPVIATVLLFMVFLLSDRKDLIEATPIEDIIPYEMGENELVNAKFEAQNQDNEPFSITAERAFQDGEKGEDGNNDQVQLKKPMANMSFNDGTQISLKGKNGTYTQDNQILHLEGDVLLSHDDQYELLTESVDINIETQTAISTSPVSGHGPVGNIEASGLLAKGQENIFIFKGPAVLILNPEHISK